MNNSPDNSKQVHVDKILLSTGWSTDKTLTITNGIITGINSGYFEGAEKISGVVIPGMINCHSHAFQRAFAGFSEQGSDGQDSFWTWRKVMYQFLEKIDVTSAETIATQLYIEMLKMGYTRVAEFHYLHHDEQGHEFLPLTEMARAIFSAAQMSGIGLTLLPVLYCYSGFGSLSPNEGQKRFINSPERFNQLVSDCFDLSEGYENTNVGIAPHSLRAVDKAGLMSAITHVRSLDEHAPIHIHIAEQQKEVDDCVNYYGKRPVEWLLDNFDLDAQWCLIHATHINEQERKGIIQTSAVAGICPTTEANLGDGIFPTKEFLSEKGIFAIGSDSHISVNPIEELRWLEYVQRLTHQQRALLTAPDEASVGTSLWQGAAKGGAQSTHTNAGCLAIGKQADLLVLNPDATRLFAHNEQHILDSLIFASQANPISDVMVNGHWVVVKGKHEDEEVIAEKFYQVLQSLSEN